MEYKISKISGWVNSTKGYATNHGNPKSNPSNPSVLDALPDRTPVNLIDEPLAFSDILSAIRRLKNNTAFGPEGLPAEALKHEGAS